MIDEEKNKSVKKSRLPCRDFFVFIEIK